MPEYREVELSPRLREIAVLLATGHNAAEVGERLGVTPNTVNAQRFLLFRQLGIHSVVALTHWCIRRGLVKTWKDLKEDA
jgi:DNA-binding NarL/FixJ family response regulator